MTSSYTDVLISISFGSLLTDLVWPYGYLDMFTILMYCNIVLDDFHLHGIYDWQHKRGRIYYIYMNIYSRNECIWNNRSAYLLWFKKTYKIGNSTSMSSGIRLNVPRCIKKEEKDVLNYIRNWDLLHDNTHSLKIYFKLRGHSGHFTWSGGSFGRRLNNKKTTSSLINKTIIDITCFQI